MTALWWLSLRAWNQRSSFRLRHLGSYLECSKTLIPLASVPHIDPNELVLFTRGHQLQHASANHLLPASRATIVALFLSIRESPVRKLQCTSYLVLPGLHFEVPLPFRTQNSICQWPQLVCPGRIPRRQAAAGKRIYWVIVRQLSYMLNCPLLTGTTRHTFTSKAWCTC